MVNDKAAATFHGSPPVRYLVMCGKSQVQLEEVDDEDEATTLALTHDQAHHCSPWVQYPLEHVHQEADEPHRHVWSPLLPPTRDDT